jgi:tRNA pseudouridine(38-40) synthase
VNLKLLLAYDGTDFAGWQTQPNQRTVQGVLEAAIHDLTGDQPMLLCAGRTDAGVHALGQVASVETRSRIPPEKWRPALQVRLPRDLVVREVTEVPARFHATYSAKSKRYRYLIHNSRVDDVMLRRHCWRVPWPLDVDAMQEAANRLLGTHDFRSFETNWPNKATSVRTVMDLQVVRTEPGSFFQGRSMLRERREARDERREPEAGPRASDEEWTVSRSETAATLTPSPSPGGRGEPAVGSGHPPSAISHPPTKNQEPRTKDSQSEFIVIEIEADGFLYNMVRTITGTLVNVGRGTWTPDDVEQILKAQNRMRAGDTCPAEGLYLVEVHYPENEDEL